MSHIEVASNVLKVEKQIDALMIKGFCTVEYDLNAMSFDRIATIIAVDLINPIVEGREFVEDTEIVERLQDSKGRLVLYWREDIASLEQYEHFWEGWEPGMVVEPIIVFIKQFRLFEKDQVFDGPWMKIYDLVFEHNK